MKTEIIKARVNIKSLTAEAAIIRREIRSTSDVAQKNILHNHKVTKVRPEARLAYLALGYLKGRKRHEVEITSKEIDVKRLLNKINGFLELTCITKEDLIEWINPRN